MTAPALRWAATRPASSNSRWELPYSERADLIITSGGTQSNHVRQTAAAAARLQIECQCVIANPLTSFRPDYLRTGNVLLDEILGAKIHIASDTDAAMSRQVAGLVERARAEGRRPYVIPIGASDAVGSVGYVACAAEFLQQCEADRHSAEPYYPRNGQRRHTRGSTHGFAPEWKQYSCAGNRGERISQIKQKKVRAVVDALLAHLGADANLVPDRDIRVLDDYVGGGYAIPSPATLAAVRTAAQKEALILDPVYTGKAMAGLIDLIGGQKLDGARDVVFLHTGGSPAMFAYTEEFWIARS